MKVLGGRWCEMKTKQKENTRQPEMEIEETENPEQLEETLIFQQINSLDETTEEKTFFSKHKSFIKICFAGFIAVGTLLLGIAAFITVMRPNSLDLNLNPEDIIKIVQAIKSEEKSQAEKSLQKVEENTKASIMDKAIVEAFRLQQVGKIDESIENGILLLT